MKPMTRRSTAVRREEIARAVVRIIGQRGITALTTSTLAAEVGLTSGALFRHFASQHEILTHATRYAVGLIQGTFPDETLPPSERLLALARNRVRTLGADPGLAWFIRSEQALLTLPPDATRLLRALVVRSKRFLLATLRAGAAEGTIRNDIDPENLLLPVMGTIHALIGMSGIHKLSAARRRNTEQALRSLMLLLAPPSGNGAPGRPRNSGKEKRS
jgi:AcrR family transcriptional regulator